MSFMLSLISSFRALLWNLVPSVFCPQKQNGVLCHYIPKQHLRSGTTAFVQSIAKVLVCCFMCLTVVSNVWAESKYDVACATYEDLELVKKLEKESILSSFPEHKKRAEIRAFYFKKLMNLPIGAKERMAILEEEIEKLSEVTSRAYLVAKHEVNEKSTKDFFVEVVNERISEGWSLQGGAQVFSYETKQKDSNIIDVRVGYCQTLFKNKQQ